MRARKAGAKLIVLILSAGMLIFNGCSGKNDRQHENDGKLVIGFSMDSLKEERWYKDRDLFTDAAKKLGASVIVSVAYDSDAQQQKQVRAMLEQNIDVLVIIPHDAEAEAKSVALAKKNGVKVISYDRLVKNAGVDLYISFDNVKVGEYLASSMIAAVPQGNYVIVNGPASDYNSIMINDGIKSVLNPYIKDGSIQIVKEVSTADWMADEASTCIGKLLKDNIRINAVIAENDGLAGGAINALAENRLIPAVPVVGMDADLAACKRVVEGQQLMSVYKPIGELAQTAAEYAVALAKGETLKVSGRIYDGKTNVPYYKIDPIAVSKENMVSTVIKDGFHTMDDVYMNIPASEWPKS